MSRPFNIEIVESEEELRKRLQTTTFANQKEKLQILWWIKSDKIKEQEEIGKCLATDTSTITRWLQKYRKGGLYSLLEIKKAPGAKRIPPHTHKDDFRLIVSPLKRGFGVHQIR